MTAHLPDADRDALRVLTRLAMFFVALAGLGYVFTISWVQPIPRDATTLVVGRDFLNFWFYGQAAFAPNPGRYYDPAVFNSLLESLLGPGYPGQNWSYPPNFLVLTAPFGLFPYLPALALWTAFGIAVFVGLVGRQVDRHALSVIMLSPAAVFCLISGQTSLLTAGALLASLAWLDRRPIIAGVLIGLVTIKPQLGLMVPVMLIASRRWTVFVSATVTALALAGLTTALFGWQAWLDYIRMGLPTQNLVLFDPTVRAAPFMPTIFMNAHAIGASYELAMAIQLCFTLAAIAAVHWAFRFHAKSDPLLLMGLFFACMVFGSPYLLVYDTLALTVAALALLTASRLDGIGRRMAQLVYWLPLIQMVLGTWQMPGAALIAPAFAFYLVLRLHGETEAAPARELSQRPV
jgi:hypothetical protein